eukprot:9407540-Alexandrium_andersonii.AAC.1
MAAWVKSCRDAHRTWHAIWEALVWSLGCLFEGRHPDKDFGGKDWPSGSYGAIHRGLPLTSDG